MAHFRFIFVRYVFHKSSQEFKGKFRRSNQDSNVSLKGLKDQQFLDLYVSLQTRLCSFSLTYFGGDFCLSPYHFALCFGYFFISQCYKGVTYVCLACWLHLSSLFTLPGTSVFTLPYPYSSSPNSKRIPGPVLVFVASSKSRMWFSHDFPIDR